jgi:NAD-dependent dihydropyrimidine dehydrogenase PreA subunit
VIQENKTILICTCAERGLLQESEEVARLIASGQAAAVLDLCEEVKSRNPVLKDIASADQPVAYACHPRAVKALFEYAGHPLPESAEFINLRDPSIQPSGNPSLQSPPAWYPVIDRDRCTNCGQCFEFCLFGVYEKDEEGRVIVAKPESCKNNCPACARICPEAAIIFPKTAERPINGAEVTDDEALKANIQVNVDEILGDDVYAALNARKQKRRSLLNKKKVAQALAERKKCSGGGS